MVRQHKKRQFIDEANANNWRQIRRAINRDRKKVEVFNAKYYVDKLKDTTSLEAVVEKHNIGVRKHSNPILLRWELKRGKVQNELALPKLNLKGSGINPIVELGLHLENSDILNRKLQQIGGQYRRGRYY